MGIQLRWQNSNNIQRPYVHQDLPILENVCSFEKSHTKFPPAVPDIECKLCLLNKEVMSLLDKEEYYTDNLPREERRALIGLKKRINDREIRISTSDKEGEFYCY